MTKSVVIVFEVPKSMEPDKAIKDALTALTMIGVPIADAMVRIVEGTRHEAARNLD